jgi:hypothetical protein
MSKITSKTGLRKQAEFMKPIPRAPCRQKKTDPNGIDKSEGQFAGFKDHFASLNPGLHHLIREERTFLDAFEALPSDMRNILESEFRKYTGQ